MRPPGSAADEEAAGGLRPPGAPVAVPTGGVEGVAECGQVGDGDLLDQACEEPACPGSFRRSPSCALSLVVPGMFRPARRPKTISPLDTQKSTLAGVDIAVGRG
ncbi:hypothetical protein Kpho01_31020 [Kitasatospora phosalacinea]|uniref:Uncharacterized protein n=1 Tax=Kitasatospora phosalacinea TaxID=2065 RepID=A0A9W6UM53_9ACTN|nr:hypothetical protein Kpho01_31020 [Kitasatospora phosalacinea]